MIIIRNDDVNPNSNFEDIQKMYALFKKYIPDVKIYSCVTLLAKTSDNGSAYPEIPLKEIYTPDVDRMFDLSLLPQLENIASHGLFHSDHQHSHAHFQRHSIVASCRILNTDLFVPPFWRWGSRTKRICDEHGIKLWTDGNWINLDRNEFVEGHKLYLLHSWTMTPEQLEEKLKRHFK